MSSNLFDIIFDESLSKWNDNEFNVRYNITISNSTTSSNIISDDAAAKADTPVPPAKYKPVYIPPILSAPTSPVVADGTPVFGIHNGVPSPPTCTPPSYILNNMELKIDVPVDNIGDDSDGGNTFGALSTRAVYHKKINNKKTKKKTGTKARRTKKKKQEKKDKKRKTGGKAGLKLKKYKKREYK